METKSIEYPKIGRAYKHYKGGEYEVITLSKHSETGEDMVVYKSLHFGSVYVRPLNLWFEVVADGGRKVKRFTLRDKIYAGE